MFHLGSQLSNYSEQRNYADYKNTDRQESGKDKRDILGWWIPLSRKTSPVDLNEAIYGGVRNE